jgi:hypothetical protein
MRTSITHGPIVVTFRDPASQANELVHL